MSKQNKSVTLEPKILSFFSVIHQDGGYKILELSIDINTSKIIDARNPTEPDVLAITFSQLQRKLRQGLGL